ncbi:hypothetical protein [Mycolicibacterium elephantis]|uniref:hypothetical protein n=1 Tax=Mycolicibacterium elephantis TaxID=81858 RepID=UPI0007E9A106|nr:hypothetical protein [Mycolicibacterium elephantis]OBB20610.1 hypothetical protein A5762_15240 [Mycolicibacterium elephantis]
MPELEPVDLERYTQGRLNKDDSETARLLEGALGLARQYCGWPVTPEQVDVEVTVDGPRPWALELRLPTLQLNSITSLSEDGVELDVANDLEWSEDGTVVKKNRSFWTAKRRGIVAVITHGLPDGPEAKAWQSAVLSVADRASQAVGGGDVRVIGPFQYDTAGLSAGRAFTESERLLLDLYRLEPSP